MSKNGKVITVSVLFAKQGVARFSSVLPATHY